MATRPLKPNTFHERRALLNLALVKVECDLRLAHWCFHLLNLQLGSEEGDWHQITYERLASRPYGLCCTPQQAEYTVKTSVDLGLVLKEPRQDAVGTNAGNAYRLDWAGIAKASQATVARRPQHAPASA